MKKLLLPVCLLLAGATKAQEQHGKASEVAPKGWKEGKVIYERTMQMRRPQGLDPEIAARIPAQRTDVYELLFTSTRSLWRSVPRADGAANDVTVQGPGGNVSMFRAVGMNDEVYHNFEKAERVEKREMFDNEFIVTDSIRRLNWKLSEETRQVLGYTARKAVAQRIGTRMTMTMENGEMKRTPIADTSTITAWYTTDFPVSVGPQEYQGQLPGLILEVDVNNGRMLYRAVELSPKVSVSSIKEPRGGKRLTPAEFEKEQGRLLEDMRRNMPQGAQIRISQ